MKGQFARRAMELGGFPVRTGVECSALRCDMGQQVFPKPRLIQAMRKIDPDLARMIESLAPAYLVKE